MRLAIALVLLALVLTGCDESGPTLTAQRATELGEQRLTDAASQLTPSPSLQRRPDQDVPCDAPDKKGPSKVTIGRNYLLTGVDPARGAEYVDLLRGYWSANGYTVVQTSTGEPFLGVENTKDHQKLYFAVRDGEVTLSAVLSCIWPDGAAPRTT